jgi:hypothetical protein
MTAFQLLDCAAVVSPPDKRDATPGADTDLKGFAYRRWVAIAVLSLVTIYAIGIVVVPIPETRRLSTTDAVVIVIALLIALFLLNPAWFERLKKLEFHGLKVELDNLKRGQERQREQLELTRFILPILLPEAERNHLLNLETHRVSEYVGSGTLRAELRRLRSVGLIEKLFNRNIGDIADGKTVNLADYVRLTKLGEQWVTMIRQSEEAR